MKLTILISGSGTNLENILNKINEGVLSRTQVIKVVADRDCYGLERAKKHSIPTALVPRGKDFDQRVEVEIPQETDFIVLAGFLSILSKEFTEKWKGKIINIHPSLLPKYGGKGMYGMKVHQAVLDNNESTSGATVHFVTAGIDEGEIILQKEIKLGKNWNAEQLAEAVHQVEYEVLIEALILLENP